MSNPPSRGVIQMVFRNFLNSLKPRQWKGNFMGEDYFGNKYYEIPANPSIGQRRVQRWFEPTEKEAYGQEITAEWEAWLRGRRKEPPTAEELTRNLAIMKMKERNAAKLDEKYGKKKDVDELEKRTTGMGSFPEYEEYEVMPGKGKREK
ncbi:NADH dehydrogenase [ubiquinone] 1 alpha subcomplex assembly factor 2-like [Topomyia yanbarensis]|uniref:NADH dehydrogenase [ubiquinone] 1 alpha subcomplex assembly factor 2-like n=1 Tax=Topomyia yanbarensis TaxID=2498891 RepID=UPI00273C6478|nr:NADH dehydrogenase [ubiquinone] 1 alpha subcomplex assembly factor 2-like [Topomyia yanbarensis]XP_058838997.1 NADH dehydrogenase [ubiquinone] 1 alpha subcomplex assembly factor 2-like [Topomyia yanbarensis]